MSKRKDVTAIAAAVTLFASTGIAFAAPQAVTAPATSYAITTSKQAATPAQAQHKVSEKLVHTCVNCGQKPTA